MASRATRRYYQYYRDLMKLPQNEWQQIDLEYGHISRIWDTLPDNEDLIFFYEDLRDYHEQRNLWHDYLEWSIRVLALARRENIPEDAGALLNNMGICCVNLGRLYEARDHYQASISILREIDEIEEAAIAYNNLGTVHEQLGDLNEAMDAYQRVLIFLDEVGNPILHANVLNNLGVVSSKKGQLIQAIDYYERSLTLFEENSIEDRLAGTYTNLGDAYAKLEQWDTAFIYYEKALEIQIEIDDKYGMATTWTSLGLLHAEQSETNKALEYYEKATYIQTELDDQDGLAHTLNNIALLYADEDPDKAMSYYERSYAIAEASGNKSLQAATIGHQVYIYASRFQIWKAISQALHVVELYVELGDVYNESINRRNLGLLYHSLEHYTEAIEQMSQAVELSRDIQHPYYEDNCAILAEFQTDMDAQ